MFDKKIKSVQGMQV